MDHRASSNGLRARILGALLALGAFGGAACCWFVLVPLCLRELPTCAAFLVGGLVAGWGVVMATGGAVAVWYGVTNRRADGE